MATIDSASHWSDGAAGCRNQRPPRIGEIQRHKAVELERSPTSSSGGSSGTSSGSSSTNSSTNKSPTETTPPTTSFTPSSSNPFVPRASTKNSNSGSDSSITKDWETNAVDGTMAEGKDLDDEEFATRNPDVRPESVSDVTDENLREFEGHLQNYTTVAGCVVEEDVLDDDIVLASSFELKKPNNTTETNSKGIIRSTSINHVPSTQAIHNPLVLIATTNTTTITAISTTNICAQQSLSSPTIMMADSTLKTSPYFGSSSPLPSHSPEPPLPYPFPPPLHQPHPRHHNFQFIQPHYYNRRLVLPKTKSLDLARKEDVRVNQDEDVATGGGNGSGDIDSDEDDDRNAADRFAGIYRQTTVIQRPQNRFLANTLSQDDTTINTTMMMAKGTPAIAPSSPVWKGPVPKMQSADSRPNSPRASFSPGSSPLGSPRSNRRRTPLKESRRISIEQSGDAVQVNQYKLMEEIGKGAYGLVKLAYNKDDSTLYAMKMLSKSRLIKKAGLIGRGPKKAPSQTPLQRVYNEIAVLKKLNHPNVVKLVEVLDDPAEDCLYLAFELEHQGEVLRIPTDRPLSEERAWSVFRDALQGLEYLHYQRIIHSDIKPGNLLLGEDGHVKIADLGVCTEFLDDDATMDNKSPAGTPAFRAPETLLEGEHLYSGKAADIWSLGATLYALVYGNVPFVGLTVPVVYGKIKNEDMKFPSFPAISEDLRDLISKILIKDPAKRITLPQIKEHKWITVDGKYSLPSEEENCRLVELETEDLNSVCRSVPKLFDTFVLIKAMLKNHSFQNPFSRSPSGRAPQRGGSRLERFVTAGRSKSAPGDYDIESRHLSSENLLPVVTESVLSTCAETSEHCHEEPA